MAKRQIHSSHLSMLARCGEQFRRRYIEEEIIPPAMALLTGSATHKAIELDLQHKIDTGALAETDAVETAARDCVAAAFETGNYWLTDEERALRSSDAWRGETTDMAVKLAHCYHYMVAPLRTPTHVERWCLIELEGYPYDIAGTIDVQEGPTVIRDTKTAARAPSQAAVDGSDQLTLYSFASSVLEGQPPEELYIDALVKTKTPKAVTIKTHRDERDYEVLMRRIAVAVEAIDSGVFLPCSRDSWVCSERFCGYAATCPYFRGRTSTGYTGGPTSGK